MIFQALYQSAKNNELILVDNGFCHFHLRKDGQLTIGEIIVIPEFEGTGIAYKILQMLIVKKPKSIFAKCPEYLTRANQWYARQGFVLERIETIERTGTKINCWRLSLDVL